MFDSTTDKLGIGVRTKPRPHTMVVTRDLCHLGTCECVEVCGCVCVGVTMGVCVCVCVCDVWVWCVCVCGGVCVWR